MSSYSFIATDYEIPEVDNTKKRIITVKEATKLGIKAHQFVPWESLDPNEKVIVFDSEEDIRELVIRKCTVYNRYIRLYTDKPFTYSVEFRYTEPRGNQLLEYLKENTKIGHQLELWSIWLDNEETAKPIKPITCKADEVSLLNIQAIYDYHNGNYRNYYSCLIIER